MGLCSSMTEEQKAEKAASNAINQDIAKGKAQEMAIKKLLLLGAGESGKSTLFKQMISIYGSGYSEKDRKAYRTTVHNNTITGIHYVIAGAKMLVGEIPECKFQDENRAVIEEVESISPDAVIDPDLAQKIQQVWDDTGIQAAFENRARYQIFSGAEYFFNSLERISQEDYIPTQKDVLASRVRTTGIVETAFEIEKNPFRMFDVGGQRNERKKWIHCFEEVTAVIFVAAISEYDEVLFEDDTMNRISESLTLFDEICNSRWFKDTSVILFLNKRDLFAKKVTKVPLSKYCAGFSGPDYDYDAGVEFLRDSFVSKNRSEKKEVYSHVTCATDTDNITHVFHSVKDIIIRQSLEAGGLMDY